MDNSSLIFDDTTAQTLTATIEPGDCTQAVTWDSSDSNVATVSNGVVTPKAKGTCTITASCGDYSVTCDVTVNVENTEETYIKKDITWATGGYLVTYNGKKYNSNSTGFNTPDWLWYNSSSNLYINDVAGAYVFVVYHDSSANVIGVQVIQTTGITKLEIPDGTSRVRIGVQSNSRVTSNTISEMVQLLIKTS